MIPYVVVVIKNPVNNLTVQIGYPINRKCNKLEKSFNNYFHHRIIG